MTEKLPEAFDRASALLALDPLPDDAAERLEEIEKDCPEEFLDLFGQYWEGLLVATPPENLK